MWYILLCIPMYVCIMSRHCVNWNGVDSFAVLFIIIGHFLNLKSLLQIWGHRPGFSKICLWSLHWLIMSITFGELRYIVANVSFIFAIMTNVRCSCFSSKVLQKVWAVNDKNMDGPRLMNHSILCATEKRGGGKIMHRAGKMGRKIGAGWKLCIGKRCLQGSLTHLMPRWLTQFEIACV